MQITLQPLKVEFEKDHYDKSKQFLECKNYILPFLISDLYYKYITIVYDDSRGVGE